MRGLCSSCSWSCLFDWFLPVVFGDLNLDWPLRWVRETADATTMLFDKFCPHELWKYLCFRLLWCPYVCGLFPDFCILSATLLVVWT